MNEIQRGKAHIGLLREEQVVGYEIEHISDKTRDEILSYITALEEVADMAEGILYAIPCDPEIMEAAVMVSAQYHAQVAKALANLKETT